MNIEKLVPIALAFALMAASAGRLPQFVNSIRKAEFQLIQDSKASKWPKARLLDK